MIHVALIRGINVGSAKRVKMADLRAALEEAGYEVVRTYVNSGNVVLRSGRAAKQVAADVAKAIDAISGVTQAEDVTGPYDVIARCEGPSVDELGALVVSQIQQVPGITRTLTCPIVRL